MSLILRAPQVVITRVHGLATAAGAQLASTSDLVVASSSASFATPGVNIGLYCTTPGISLSRNLPSKHALKMLATGMPMSAQKAYELGLVSEIVNDKDLDSRVELIAESIARAPGQVSAIGKWAFGVQRDMSAMDALEWGALVMAFNSRLPDAVEGIKAFIEKRTPVWLT
ncbi:hypothetical protein HDU67_003049 [Dinochytrium kinnereticum]|nr:hypothetical protein HDU67_003049 [Dinochytrium kinnereticum]